MTKIPITQRGNSGDMRSGMERAMAANADILHAAKPGRIADSRGARPSMGVHPETSQVAQALGPGKAPRKL